MEPTTSKEILMKLCKGIVNSQKESIDILRNQPICNLKIVQRKSKNVKDPNPLSSMMSTITTKYPISVDKEKAETVGMPPSFMHKTDVHQYGRVLCKLEAIEWFLNSSPLPSQHTISAINVLFENKEKEVRKYYSYPWRDSVVTYGENFIVRNIIPTQDVLVQIPPHEKVLYVMATLMPDYVLDYDQLNPLVMDKLRIIRDLNIVSKITIQSQLRILLNTLDNKNRYIPCLANHPIEENRIRHSFASALYYIRFKHLTHSGSDETKSLLMDIGRALWIELNEKKTNPMKCFDYLRSANYGPSKLTFVIETSSELEGTYANYLLAFMGYTISSSSTIGGYVFQPIEGKTKCSLRRNVDGTRFTIYEGDEKVQIVGGNIRGFISHYGATILGLHLTKSDRKNVRSAIFATAEYCRVFFQTTRGKSSFVLRKNVRKRYEDTPWLILDMNESMWSNTLRCIDSHSVKFSEEIDPLPGKRLQGRLEGDTIILRDGSTIKVEKPKARPLFPPNLDLRGSPFIDYQQPKIRLKRKIEYYLANYAYICENIKKYNFMWENLSIMDGLPTAIRHTVGLTSQRYLILGADRDLLPSLVCLLYCFAGTQPVPLPPGAEIDTFQWFSSHKVSFRLDEGIAKFKDGELTLFDQPLEGCDNSEVEKFLPCLLSGYVFLNGSDPDVPYRDITYLRRKENEIKSGVLFNISLFGNTYLVRRDILANMALLRTITRNMQSICSSVVFENMIMLSRTAQKRPMDNNNDEEPSTSKRVRLTEPTTIDPFDLLEEDPDEEELFSMDDY